jgi:ribosomal protein L29
VKDLKQEEADKLRQRLFELRGELSQLKGRSARGLIQKEGGKIRRVRRDIARILTAMQQREIQE